MKKIIALTSLFLLLTAQAATAQTLAQKLSGRILLQVQFAGQAWYVNPTDGQKYYLGRPNDAFEIMRQLGLGISNTNFNRLSSDKDFIRGLKGRIILQVQSVGQAWYVNPTDGQKYYLGRPANAFEIMKRLALGVTDQTLAQIPTKQLLGSWRMEKVSPPIVSSAEPSVPASNQESALTQAAVAVRSNNSAQAQASFTSEMRKAVEYTMKILNADSRLLLANILSGAKLESQTESQKIYSNEVYFSLGGYKVPVKFRVKKQSDGSWLIANL